MISRYKRGTTVRITATIKDADGTLYSPDTSTKITVLDPDGTVEVNAQDMTESSTGVFYYDWQSESDDATGDYKVRVTSVDGTKTSIEVDTSSFQLHDD